MTDEWIKKKFDTCYSIDDPWRQSAKWNNPVRKGQILHDWSKVIRVGKFIETE